MSSKVRASGRRGERGTSLIEFAFLAFALMVTLFASIELDRMLFLYTNLADAAKAGLRYAITHGSDRSGSGTDGPSGPTCPCAQVNTAVTNYITGLDQSQLTVTVSYPDGSNTIGSNVQVTVQYPYNPLNGLGLFNGITLSATSKGIIAF